MLGLLGYFLIARHDFLLYYQVLLQLIAYEVVGEFTMDLLKSDIPLEGYIEVSFEKRLPDLETRKV